MKKFFAILMVLAIMLTLFSCVPGGSTPQNPDDPNNGNGTDGTEQGTDVPKNPFEGGGTVDLPILPAA